MKRGLRFWINRALRLLPPYYFVCTLTLLANRVRAGAGRQLSEILARRTRRG